MGACKRFSSVSSVSSTSERMSGVRCASRVVAVSPRSAGCLPHGCAVGGDSGGGAGGMEGTSVDMELNAKDAKRNRASPPPPVFP